MIKLRKYKIIRTERHLIWNIMEVDDIRLKKKRKLGKKQEKEWKQNKKRKTTHLFLLKHKSKTAIPVN